MTDILNLQGRAILVTGGTRGIGRAISLQLARAGATVVANYARDEAAAQALAQEAVAHRLQIVTLRADLTLPKGLEAIQQCFAALPPAQVVSIVHCAATGVHRRIEQLSTRHWDFTHALNVRAFFELVHALRPRLGAGSAVVALSSAGAERAVPAYAAVGSSKAALESLVRHLAAELAPLGVRANVVAPGSIETDAWKAFPDKEQRLADAVARTPLGRLVSANEVALAVQFLCSDAAAGIVGHTLVVDGGARVVP